MSLVDGKFYSRENLSIAGRSVMPYLELRAIIGECAAGIQRDNYHPGVREMDREEEQFA
jgi:hypothetical protein